MLYTIYIILYNNGYKRIVVSSFIVLIELSQVIIKLL